MDASGCKDGGTYLNGAGGPAVGVEGEVSAAAVGVDALLDLFPALRAMAGSSLSTPRASPSLETYLQGTKPHTKMFKSVSVSCICTKVDSAENHAMKLQGSL